jgi:hypothetical protein
VARDTSVFAFVRADPVGGRDGDDPWILLHDLRFTASTTATTIAGGSLPTEATAGGLRVRLDEPLDRDVPIALALHHAEATAAR